MADRITKEQRSKNMAAIRGKDTLLEKKVRSFLFARGYRFRKNDKRYPGKPDIILPKYKTVIFINGCFWHHHADCKFAYIPKSNTDYWIAKFSRNINNDVIHKNELEELGFTVIILWECELKKDFRSGMNTILKTIKNH